MSQTEREDWQRYSAAMRAIAAAFGTTVYCHQKNNRLAVDFRSDGLTWEQFDALAVIENLVELVSEFQPGYLEHLERPGQEHAEGEAWRRLGMLILVIDLEATCADDGSITPEQMEVIEIGAVWATPAGQIIDRFQSFVRPIERPQLTSFCMELTGIVQTSIDAAPTFDAVAAALTEFAQRHQQPGSSWGSWGAYDRSQIELECVRHGIADPLAGLTHQNLKQRFAKGRKIKQVGMATALRIVGLELEGAHHRALSDACNIARLLPWLAD